MTKMGTSLPEREFPLKLRLQLREQKGDQSVLVDNARSN